MALIDGWLPFRAADPKASIMVCLKASVEPSALNNEIRLGTNVSMAAVARSAIPGSRSFEAEDRKVSSIRFCLPILARGNLFANF